MTLIAAMKGDGCLFLAADSHVVENDCRMTVRKLEKLEAPNDPPLAWGFFGDEGIGREFGRKLRAIFRRQLPRNVDWDSFKDKAVLELARVNAKRRESAQTALSGHQPASASVLLAGYLSNVPNVLELDDSGGWYFIEEHNTMAIGDGKTHFQIVFKMITREAPDRPRDAALISEVTELAATFADGCALPIRLFTITPQQVVISREV